MNIIKCLCVSRRMKAGEEERKKACWWECCEFQLCRWWSYSGQEPAPFPFCIEKVNLSYGCRFLPTIASLRLEKSNDHQTADHIWILTTTDAPNVSESQQKQGGRTKVLSNMKLFTATGRVPKNAICYQVRIVVLCKVFWDAWLSKRKYPQSRQDETFSKKIMSALSQIRWIDELMNKLDGSQTIAVKINPQCVDKLESRREQSEQRCRGFLI